MVQTMTEATSSGLKAGAVLRITSPAGAPPVAYEGTLVHTTIEWGTGRRGLVILVQTSSDDQRLVGYELAFGDEWLVEEMDASCVHPIGCEHYS